MELVPTEDALVVEGMLAVNLIDMVHPGLDVEFLFSAFNTNTTPHIPGKLTSISADRSVDERTGMPYYKFRASVTPEGLKKLEGLQIRPGMPADITIKTGERTMMNYLLRPIVDRAHSALKER
jgi:protease secretion system membrane fusion protein